MFLLAEVLLLPHFHSHVAVRQQGGSSGVEAAMVGGEGRLMHASEKLNCSEPLILPVLLDCPWQKMRLGELQINQAVGCHLADYFCRYVAPEELHLPLLPEESKKWPPMVSPTQLKQHLGLQCSYFLVPYSLWGRWRVSVVWSVGGGSLVLFCQFYFLW